MTGDSFEDSVTPIETEQQALEGETVTVSCNYSGSVRSLHWYRQFGTAAPEFLNLILEAGNTVGNVSRVVPKIHKGIQRVDLEISPAKISDSALYYCALEPTVTGNPVTLHTNLPLSKTGAK